jgi:peptide/nickel transport system substrate-binding protein
MRRFAQIRAALVVLMVALLGTACFSPANRGGESALDQQRLPQQNAGPAQPGGVFRYTLPSDAKSLDPTTQSSFNTHIAIGSTYSKLVDYKTGADIPYGASVLEGDLAEKWGVSPDGLTWTFNLRHGVKWHNTAPVNGREFTSADVVCTMDRIRSLPGQQSGQLATVAGWSAPDPYTVAFTLKTPYAEFDTTMAGHFMWILPCEGTQGKFDLNTQAIGTGAYVLQTWSRDKERILVKNPDYYVKGEPNIDRIEISIVPDQAAALAAYRTGRADYLSVLTLDKTQAEKVLAEDPKSILFREAGITQTRIFMNQARTPFDKLPVRRAIALAIDRKAMVAAIRAGGHETGPVSPTLLGGLTPEEDATLQPYDPEQAKKLLAEAGLPGGFSAKMIVTDGYGANVVREAQWVQQDLAKVGITIELDVQDYATYFTESWAGKNYDIGYGLQTPFLAADDYLTGEWLSTGTRNWYNINDPQLDAMINKQRGELDKAARENEIREIQRYIIQNVSNPVPLYVYDGLSIYKDYLHDAWPHPDYGTRHQARMWLGPEAPGRTA